MATLFEWARRDPRCLLLRSAGALQVSLERNTRNVPRDGRFHVRVRGRTIFSGCFSAAQARYERARHTQHLRQRAALRRQSARPFSLQRRSTLRRGQTTSTPPGCRARRRST